MKLTRESARAAGACYDDSRIACLVPPGGLTPAQVARLPIPAEDRHWALVMACGATRRTLREHAVWCARQALALVPHPDARSVVVCEVAERFARGEATQEELSAAARAARAAWDAALDAARAARDAARAARAARDAARAAWDAALDAARAARDAAWDAAWADAWAAWDAARAARDAARAAQIADLVRRLESQ